MAFPKPLCHDMPKTEENKVWWDGFNNGYDDANDVWQLGYNDGMEDGKGEGYAKAKEELAAEWQKLEAEKQKLEAEKRKSSIKKQLKSSIKKQRKSSIKKQRESSSKAYEDGYTKGLKKAMAVVVEELDQTVQQVNLFGPDAESESGEDE